MVIETDRFGEIDLADKKVIEFPGGLPGFEELNQFIILEVTESKPLYWLQSIQDAYIALPVVIPFEFMDDYFIEIRDAELEELEIENNGDLLVLNVVTVPEEVHSMTANLAAPIIINTRTGVGRQIIIDARELPIRYPIFELIIKKLKGGEADAGSVAEEG
ncbi:flagellar assembly protein FliW [Eubacteriales bacterium OttesenSCG-928-M02]|nr:flagellar assembly protein FliW [Eubacteriales bacterium OttesenSCG-928-M02]